MVTSLGARRAAWTAVLLPAISRPCLIMSILIGNCKTLTNLDIRAHVALGGTGVHPDLEFYFLNPRATCNTCSKNTSWISSTFGTAVDRRCRITAASRPRCPILRTRSLRRPSVHYRTLPITTITTRRRNARGALP